MRELGKDLDETKADVAIVLGSDYLDTFFLSSVPTCAVIAGEQSHASFASREYNLPIHQGFVEDLLDSLVRAGFDMAYSQDAILGHSFAAIYEWVIEGRAIPVIPIFVNAYLPPLPSARRCEALGKAIAEIIAKRPERVVRRRSPPGLSVQAHGGAMLTHYEGAPFPSRL